MSGTVDPTGLSGREDVAAALTALRERAGLSVRDLARRSGVPLATVGGYLSGRHLPQAASRDVLRRLLTACGVSSDELEQWLDAIARVRRTPPVRGDAPYRGLAPYTEADAGLFFGRDDAVTTLASAVRDGTVARPVIVLGASGSGKSSLLRAGLVPAVEAARWTTAVVVLGDDPVAALAAGVCVLTGEPERQLVARWTAGDRTARDATAERALLVVDQFEQVFARDAETVATVANVVTSFAAVPRRRVVLGVRSDFFAQTAAVPELVRALQTTSVLLAPMTVDQLRDVVVLPAARQNVTVDPSLVDVVLRDVVGRGSREVPAGALPLLSHALLSTWSRGARGRLTLEDYEATGGVEGALARTAEQAFGLLDGAAQDAARAVLLGMVRVVDGVPMARRGLDRSAVPSGADADRALEALVDARLVTVSDDRLEVAHESLLWAWPRLAGWLEEEQEALGVRARLGDAARFWEDHGRDPSLLYRGAPLAAVLAWSEGPGRHTPLMPAEREFLAASADAADAERRQERAQTARVRRLSALLAVLLVLSVVLAGFAVRQSREQSDLRSRAVSRQLASAADRLRGIDPTLSGQLAVAAYRQAPTPEALASLLAAAASPTATRLLTTGQAQQAVSISPDGRWLASTGADAKVHVWPLAAPAADSPGASGPAAVPGVTDPTGTATPAGTKTLFALAFTPDGRALLAGGMDGSLLRWSVGPTGALTPLPPLGGLGGTVYAVAFGAGRLAAVTSGGVLWTWPEAAAAAPGPTAGTATTLGKAALQAVAFSPDSTMLAVGGADGVLRVLDLATMAPLPTTAPAAVGALYAVAFTADGTILAGSRDRTVHRYALRDQQVTDAGSPLTGPKDWVNGLAVRPDGQVVAGASSDRSTWLWDARSGAVIGALPQPTPATAVRWIAGGLVVAGTDGSVRLWQYPTASAGGVRAQQFTAAFSDDGRWAGTAGRDGARLIRLRAGAPVGDPVVVPAPPGSGRLTGALAFAPGGRKVALGATEVAAHVVDLTATPPAVVATLGGPTGLVEQVAYSADGRLLAAGNDDNVVLLFDAGSGRLLATVRGPDSYVYSVAFSPDSRTLAVGSVDTTVRLYDVSDPAAPRTLGEPLRESTGYVYGVAFTGDGRRLVTGSDDKQLRLYDVTDLARPRLIGTSLATDSTVLALSVVGDAVAAGTADGGIVLADVRSAGLVVRAVLPGGPGATSAVALSPDGRQLLSSGAEPAARFWALDPVAARQRVCAVGGTPVTAQEWARYAPDQPFRLPCT